MVSNLLDIDARYIWHPYTQHATEHDPILLAGAKGTNLITADGREILDLVSSWWTCIHGHAHPEINAALAQQADAMEHVMFGGFTHAPAIRLAERLSEILPEDLSRVFFSDNGSTSVEVALKMAFQYWRNRGDTRRNRFLAFEGAYHGDTFGAMAVGRGCGFFNLFQDLMCPVSPLPYVHTWENDETVEAREAEALNRIDQILAAEGDHAAALIVEPLMQGASGMRVCRPEFLRQVVERVQAAGLLVIFDEVATGFGRTGTMFAFEQVGVVPDLICLSKGLTAGYMPMAVTVARETLFQAFLSEGFEKALPHGHTFTANPLACAVSLRSLELFDEEGTLGKVAQIAERHTDALEHLMEHPRVTRPRRLGTLLAFDLLGGGEGYKSDESLVLRDWYLANGLNIRPLGPCVYLMPPYCITEDELDRAYSGMMQGLESLGH